MEQDIDGRLLSYLSTALAPSTRDAYRRYIRRFHQFCDEMGYQPLPASALTLARYVTHLTTDTSLASIRCHLSALRMEHVVNGHATAPLTDPLVHYVLRGIERTTALPPRQMLPMTPALLHRGLEHLNLHLSEDRLFWGAALLMLFTLLRRSNVLATSATSQDSNLLRRADITLGTNQLILRVSRTKTRSATSPAHVIRLPSRVGHVMCPVGAVRIAMRVWPSTGTDCPIFVWPDGRPFLYHQFMTKLRTILVLLREDPRAYGTHSFRRGGATLAANAGVTSENIRALGDWHSDAYLRYVTPNVAQSTSMMLHSIH